MGTFSRAFPAATPGLIIKSNYLAARSMSSSGAILPTPYNVSGLKKYGQNHSPLPSRQVFVLSQSHDIQVVRLEQYLNLIIFVSC